MYTRPLAAQLRLSHRTTLSRKVHKDAVQPLKLWQTAQSLTQASTFMADPGSSAVEQLPKLTPAEFKVYNHMAEGMEYFHTHFKQTWAMMQDACKTNQRPSGMSIKQFLSASERFCQHLTMHHGIEEAHIFPLLAKKMPEFREELELLEQHKQIHTGLERLEEYIHRVQRGESDFRFDELREVLDSFGGVLWEHLNQEVKTLGAENMRKYWTIAEMKQMPL